MKLLEIVDQFLSKFLSKMMRTLALNKSDYDYMLYQDSNALVTCFEHVDIQWYHLLITP